MSAVDGLFMREIRLNRRFKMSLVDPFQVWDSGVGLGDLRRSLSLRRSPGRSME